MFKREFIKLIQKQLLILLFLFPCVLSYAAVNSVSEGTILIISSYNPETRQTSTNISAFLDEYASLGGNTSSVIIENMNCNNFSEAIMWREKMRNILDKYKGDNTPELIILLGQEAWTSYLSQKKETLNNIPVMCGMVSRNALILPEDSISLKDWEPESIDAFKDAEEYNIVAGYAYEYDIEKNIRLIKDLYPDTKNIAFISDNTYGGVSMQALARKEISAFPELNLILLDGRKHSIYTIVSDISQLPENTVILVGTWRVDTNEGYFMRNATYAMREANPEISAFTVASTGLGYWVIGGYIPDYRIVGKDMAHQAMSYLNNQERKNVKIEFVPGHYVFDMHKLLEKNISIKKLPAGYQLINKEPTFFEEYKYQITLFVSIFLIVLVGFLVSLYHYLRTKKLKDELEHSETKLRIAKDRAEESNRLKSAFIANMSHEIRTPLNAIVGFSNLLASEGGTEEQKEYFEIIQTNSDLLLHLINDILDISRLESGKMKFAYEDCDVIELCKAVISSAEYTRRAGVNYVFESQQESFKIQTDIQRLKQVLNNLLSNAGKFTSEGSITLKCRVDEEVQLIFFSVTDTGCGIPEKKQDLVFERFEKLDEYTQGTGLGLSITKLIVEKLGGKIWIDSEYKEGARFIFTHPLHIKTEEE